MTPGMGWLLLSCWGSATRERLRRAEFGRAGAGTASPVPVASDPERVAHAPARSHSCSSPRVADFQLPDSCQLTRLVICDSHVGALSPSRAATAAREPRLTRGHDGTVLEDDLKSLTRIEPTPPFPSSPRCRRPLHPPRPLPLSPPPAPPPLSPPPPSQLPPSPPPPSLVPCIRAAASAAIATATLAAATLAAAPADAPLTAGALPTAVPAAVALATTALAAATRRMQAFFLRRLRRR